MANQPNSCFADNCHNAPQLVSVQEGYDRWAQIYDEDSNPLTALETIHVKRLAGNLNSLSVLDVGCGTGRHCRWMIDAGATVTGLDFSSQMLDRAHQRIGDRARLLRHELPDPLPVHDKSADLILFSLVAEHLSPPDLRSVLLDFKRVLKGNGSIIFSTLHPNRLGNGERPRFYEPKSGKEIRINAFMHSCSSYLDLASETGFICKDVLNVSPSKAFALQFPRATKYIGDYFLFIMLMVPV